MLFGSKESKIAKAAAKRNSKWLIGLLTGKDKSLAIKAMEALSTIKQDDDAFNALIPHLHNQDPEMRAAAATALGNIENIHGKAHLSFQLQNEKDPKVREALQAAMSKLKNE